MEQAALKHHAIAQATLKRTVDAFFGCHHSQLAHATNHQGSAQGFFHEFVGGHHATHQACALCFLRIHHAAGQGQVHGLRFAHRAR